MNVIESKRLLLISEIKVFLAFATHTALAPHSQTKIPHMNREANKYGQHEVIALTIAQIVFCKNRC